MHNTRTPTDPRINEAHRLNISTCMNSLATLELNREGLLPPQGHFQVLVRPAEGFVPIALEAPLQPPPQPAPTNDCTDDEPPVPANCDASDIQPPTPSSVTTGSSQFSSNGGDEMDVDDRAFEFTMHVPGPAFPVNVTDPSTRREPPHPGEPSPRKRKRNSGGALDLGAYRPKSARPLYQQRRTTFG